MDYMTLLKNLDKIANANLMKAVKNIVKDHPVILIIDNTHDHKQYAIPVSRNTTQAYYHKVHKKYEPAIQILIITVYEKNRTIILRRRTGG